MRKKWKSSGTEHLDLVDTLLFELKKSINVKETVVFCGAGISLHSGLPLANDLVLYVLEKLTVSQKETKTIINSNLPFEAFIETLCRNSSPDKIFDIFGIGEPNTNHFLLAKLVKAKYLKTICTTNFDQLIEEALKSEGLVRGDDFQVLYKEDDFDHIDWNDDKIRLIKIHGSIEDTNNMAITLRRVANKILSEPRKKVIEHIFSKGAHKNVLILGYSCSDVFDISPQIETIRENHKKVIYIDHHKDEQEIRHIGDKIKNNPFKFFKGGKWVLYDTDELVEALWNFYFPEDNYLFPRSIIDSTLWKKCVDDWLEGIEEKLTSKAKYNIAGSIFLQISEYKSVIVYCEQALSIAGDIGNKLGKAVFGNLGNAYLCLGDYEKAIEYYGQALSIARDIDDKRGEVNVFGNLGVAYCYLGDYQKAIECNEQALSVARDIGDKEGEGQWLSSLGATYHRLGDYQKATEYYDQALSIARDTGNKRGEGNTLDNLGNAYLYLGDYQKAIEYNEQALSVTRDIGDKEGEGVSLRNLGANYCHLGDYQKAIEYNEQALSIARDIGDRRNEENSLGNLGNAYCYLGNYHKAKGYYEQALSVARDIGDKEGEGNWFGNLGAAYHSLGDYQKAIECNEQALSVTRDIGNKRGEGNALGNLAIAYCYLGGYQKAIEYYEQALNITRDIDDKRGEGSWLSNLGNVYHRLGDYQKAIEYYDQALAILQPMLGDDHPDTKLIERDLRRIKAL